MDYQKALDIVFHVRLLEKLRAHGVRGNFLAWIRNWLKNRQQRVVINGESSNWSDVTSGVPQGAVLGGLILFIVYINGLDTDIISYISKFADDIKIGSSVDNKCGSHSI